MNAIAPASGLPRRCAPDGTTSHSTKPASWQVAGYRNDRLLGSGSSGLGDHLNHFIFLNTFVFFVFFVDRLLFLR